MAPCWKERWLRIYLTGRVRIEIGDILLDEGRLPGRQGRTAFVMLVAERDRPVAREELAEELWPGHPPAAWEPALRAIVSKLRAALAPAGLAGDALAGSFGCYQLHLPAGAWVDLEAAAAAVHEASRYSRRTMRGVPTDRPSSPFTSPVAPSCPVAADRGPKPVERRIRLCGCAL